MSTQIKTENKPKVKSFDPIRLIINNSVPLLFLIICAIGIEFSGINKSFILNEVITRIGRNSFLVLSLIIPVIAGMGLNFALVIGAMAGQIGLMIIKVMDIGGVPGILLAILFSTPFALLFGFGTGKILNKTKGREMITSLVLGFFAMGLYQLVFLSFIGTIIPVKNPEIVLSNGVGFKNAMDLKFIMNSIDYIWRPSVDIHIWTINLMGIKFPMVTLLIIALLCWFTRFIVKTKLGQDFRALGQDLHIAKVAGINTDRTRIIAISISTVLAAWGQVIFLQNLGTMNTYASHEQVGMFAIAALLVGGASVTRATISQALIGTVLLHTLFIVSPYAGKNIFGDAQIGEFFRVFVAYGVIAMSLVLHSWQKHMNSKHNALKE